MTVILVDGPDGTGKTGYAHWISEEWGIPFVRHEPDENFGTLDGEVIELMAESFNRTLVQFAEQGIDMVVDRGPVSSIVYSEVFNRDDPDHAYDALQRLDPLIVYLRCEPDELEIRYDDEKFDNVGEIAEEYETVMDSLQEHYEIHTIDTSSGAPGEIHAIVGDEIVNMDPADE